VAVFDIRRTIGAFSTTACGPGAWVVQFKGAGHGLMYQDQEGLAGTVLFFIEA